MKRRKAILVGTGVLLLSSASPGPAPPVARADLVFGHVSGGGFRAARDSFVIVGADSTADSTVIRTNLGNDYKLILDPGTYRAEFRDKHGRLWTATIQAAIDPICQNIAFKKARR